MDWLKQWLFPQACLLCRSASHTALGLCAPCLAELPWHDQHIDTPQACPQCALPTIAGQRCGRCLQQPPAFDATHSLFQYTFPLTSMLQRYKYAQHLALAPMLGQLLAKTWWAHSRAHSQHAIATSQHQADCLIPMPLHRQRLQERGFNQSLEIARKLCRELNIPLQAHLCVRTRATPPQATLPYRQRLKNMRGAFACHTPLTGQRVILLDDVMTTGASLNALAQCVKAAGATHVECWVIARTFTT